jgi:hypothetical protein
MLCQGLGAEHTPLLLHIEVQQLSGGNVLNHVPELREEMQAFFILQKH